jgi:hypothetical protein
MHDSVAAIRTSRSRPRFVLSPVHRRERRLGLHRLFRTPVPLHPADVRSQPLSALRNAARGSTWTPGSRRAANVDLLHREPRMRWSADERPPLPSTAPWRG